MGRCNAIKQHHIGHERYSRPLGIWALLLCTVLIASTSVQSQAQTNPVAQATSLSGRPLYASAPSENALQKLAEAQQAYAANPTSADALIWLGRRAAYTGDYVSAIETFSKGIEMHPADPRFYRHRGHRYISTRNFNAAIDDLERAAVLMHGTPRRIEPDGLPNAQNIPLTSTQGNVWYHLGLAYYLKQDWPLALAAFRNGYRLGENDDNLVSAGHWIYMILRRMGDKDAADRALDDITKNMTIIENMSYHQLCLLYKGELAVEDLLGANGDDPSNAAVAYGVANYLYYNGDRARSDELLNRIVAGSSWSSFGYVAAEADLANSAR